MTVRSAYADGPGGARRRAGEHWTRRRELERQLHDGPALRLSALTLRLGLLAQKLPGAGDLLEDIAELQGQLHLVLQELRAIADQIYPALLQEAGLGPAVRELAGRVPVRIRVHADSDRFDQAVEGVAYFLVAQVLLDLSPDTGPVDVIIRRDAYGLALDLGGVDTDQADTVGDQIRAFGGAVEVAGGTIKVRIPCE